ncbi:Arc family DNA-binding protein [Rouxiella badensis]|uniref:Arc family DNA-binding protein n=1 Tax=Rouxiella badensis TaxID=1646377 RepID=UPI0022AB065C|nr:Arc family DNA-binding protein [Rouxiella badensis]WAT10122.1 Arc family DNA-binding protein [Rouxiella badensis]
MSREDPQFRIRLPVELKEKIEISAKGSNRTLNSEIVQRLGLSFLNEIPADELISAKEAIAIVNKAKDELSSIVFKRTFAEINKKIRIGHTSFSVELSDLELYGLSDDDFAAVFQPTFSRLKELGYIVLETSWDADGFLVEIPQQSE